MVGIVKVKPLERGGSRLGLEKLGMNRAPGTGFYIEALPDKNTRVRATGLTKEQETRLGAAINEDLTPFSKFWDTFQIKLEDEETPFDSSIPIDEVKISVLKASKLVANSELERAEGKYPEAKYVIFDSAEETKLKESRISSKLDATGYIAAASPNKRKQVATILFDRDFETETDGFVKVQLMEHVEKGNKEINSFNELVRKSEDRIEAEYLVHLGVIRNVLKKRSGRYYRGEEELGYDYTTTVDYFMSPKNQSTRLQVTNQLEGLVPHKVTQEEFISEVKEKKQSKKSEE